jgi:Rrf2 family nitric oxide-sensitive transcriptional repressor
MISQTAEYALRAVVYLAENAGGGRTTSEIAAATKVPSAYLSKVLQLLAKGDVVNSQRGLGGGFSLKKPPKKLTVLDIMNAVDPVQRIRECPLQLDAHAVRLCALHHRLDEAAAMLEKIFSKTSVAELMADGKEGNIYTFQVKSKTKPKQSRKAR